MIPADTIARALKGRRAARAGSCKCPAHDDHHPSLSVAETRDRKTLVKCWSGCRQDDVLDALRRRGLWEGKARADVASRQTPRACRGTRDIAQAVRPNEDLAQRWAMGSRFCGGHISRDSRNRAHRRRGREPAFCAGSVALADPIALAGHAGACRRSPPAPR